MGGPASGKTSYALSSQFLGFQYIGLKDLSDIRGCIKTGSNFIVDAPNFIPKDRKVYLDYIKDFALGGAYQLECHYLQTTLKESRDNAVRREAMGGVRFNKFRFVKEWVQYKKECELPSSNEGFDIVLEVPFVSRNQDKGHSFKGLFFSMLSVCFSVNGHNYPQSPQDLKVLPVVSEVFRRYYDDGYKLIGVAHLPRIRTRHVHEDDVQDCIIELVKQMPCPIDDIFYTPHRTGDQNDMALPNPHFAYLASDRHGININHSIMVGETKIDKDFAFNAGFGQYMPIKTVQRIGRRRIVALEPLQEIKSQFKGTTP